MNVKLIADEFEFESQMVREENPDQYKEELEAEREGDEDRRFEDDVIESD